MPVPKSELKVAPDRRLLADEVYDGLLDDIVRGRLAPGERIRDAELAARLGRSRSTIRSALLRLTDVGLIEAVPNLYTRVAPLDLERYFDTQDTARALYVYAARLGAPLLTDEQLAAMAVWSARLGGPRRADPEVIFSGAILAGFDPFLEAADNGPLRRTLARLWPHLQRVVGPYAHLLPVDAIDAALLEVTAAAARRDGEASAEALAAYFDGPLAVFHDRLRDVPELSSAN